MEACRLHYDKTSDTASERDGDELFPGEPTLITKDPDRKQRL